MTEHISSTKDFRTMLSFAFQEGGNDGQEIQKVGTQSDSNNSGGDSKNLFEDIFTVKSNLNNVISEPEFNLSADKIQVDRTVVLPKCQDRKAKFLAYLEPLSGNLDIIV